MSSRIYTDDEAREMLRKAIGEHRGAANSLANRLGVSAAFVSVVLCGHRPITPQMAQIIGLRKVSGWTIDDGNHAS